jgi:copper chaperone
MEQVLSVPEVHCGHCVSSIEGAVAQLEGVENVNVDLDSRTVKVVFDEGSLQLDSIVSAIEGQGYDVGGDGGPSLIQLGDKPRG